MVSKREKKHVSPGHTQGRARPRPEEVPLAPGENSLLVFSIHGQLDGLLARACADGFRDGISFLLLLLAVGASGGAAV